MRRFVGIHLGTTNSVVAVMEDGEPIVIPNIEGGLVTPSVVAVTETRERLVGAFAKRQAVMNPQNTVYSVKRLMGRTFEDPEVQRDVKLMSYKVQRAANGDAEVVMGGLRHSPAEILAMIVQKLKIDAEAYLGESVTEAVITVPAYFNDAQRQATNDAAKIAGMEVLRIIDEPTAASLAHGLDKKAAAWIAVYHLGGSTFDISILELGRGTFQVKSTNGNRHLGGDDFDQRMIDFLVEEFEAEQGIDLKQDSMALQRLKEVAEKAKIELSSAQQAEVNLPVITADATGPKHMTISITRAKLEQLVWDLVEHTLGPVKQALQDAGVTSAQIDDVVLVGGQARMPRIYRSVCELFGREPVVGVDPQAAFAMGAAAHFGVAREAIHEPCAQDVVPLSLGLEGTSGITEPLINRGTSLPTRTVRTFSSRESSIVLNVVQGERLLARDNWLLAKIVVEGVSLGAHGVATIDVEFAIDQNGMLKVAARDVLTGLKVATTVTGSGGMSRAEIEKRLREEVQEA